MASNNDIDLAFQRAGIGRAPTAADYSYYASYPDAGRVEGDLRASGGPSTNSYGFDYAKAAQDAYGEIGPYYHNLLVQYQGDMNKVLARLQQDYETGARYHATDTQTALGNADRSVMNNALARGTYQLSAYDPRAGYGLPSQDVARAEQPIQQAQQRYTEQADLNLSRQKQDQADALTKFTTANEQAQRTEAASLANSRGAQAYNSYQAKQSDLYNPSLV